jgi:NAD(P)H-dependent FMN reductase
VSTTPCRLLLVSGSLRHRSTNTAALRTAQLAAPPGVEVVLYDGLRDLPPLDPDEDAEPLDAAVAALREAVHDASAILFSTPEYAGALPGSFKNLLDWTIGDDQPGSIYEKPVAWLNTSARGADGAHRELRTVLGYAHASIIEDACRSVPVTTDMVGADGIIADPPTVDRLAEALAVLVAAVRAGGGS